MGDEVTRLKINEFESQVGRHLTWAYFSNHWLDGGIEFPWTNVQACQDAQVIPYIRMMPWSRQTENQGIDPLINLQDIVNGAWDDDLIQWAQDAKLYGRPLMVEFGPEVNGSWFPWNGKWYGAGASKGYGDPNYPDGAEIFRDAYRHIIKLFRMVGVNNVTWAFHVDAAQVPDVWWNQMKYYYPGDEYIDWIGISVHGAQLPSHQWTSFKSKLSRRLKEFLSISKVKPLFIAEYAVVESPENSGRKASWIKEMFSFLRTREMERFKAISYWHSIGYYSSIYGSMRLDSSPAALDMYRQGVRGRRFAVNPQFSDGVEWIPSRLGHQSFSLSILI